MVLGDSPVLVIVLKQDMTGRNLNRTATSHTCGTCWGDILNVYTRWGPRKAPGDPAKPLGIPQNVWGSPDKPVGST